MVPRATQPNVTNGETLPSLDIKLGSLLIDRRIK